MPYLTVSEPEIQQVPPKLCRRHDWQPLFAYPSGQYFKPVDTLLGPANGYPWHRYRVCASCGSLAVFYPASRLTRRLNEAELRAYGTGDGLAADAARWNEYLAQEGGVK